MTVREWELLCPGSTQVLEGLAQINHGQLEEDHWRSLDEEHPNRVVSWSKGGVVYSISMTGNLPPSPGMRIWVTAWRDNEQTLTRKSLQPSERVVSGLITTDAFQITIDEMFKEIRSKARVLNLRGFHEGIKISKLTPYPRTD